MTVLNGHVSLLKHAPANTPIGAEISDIPVAARVSSAHSRSPRQGSGFSPGKTRTYLDDVKQRNKKRMLYIQTIESMVTIGPRW
jgi:hypothetical protein